VQNSPRIKEIVVTGGDPFMSKDNMACTIDGLMEVEHVQTLRLATRTIAYYPEMFLSDDGEAAELSETEKPGAADAGKRMEVATHFIHPEEVSPQSLQIISELVRSGIAVYVQTPFLNDCNDEGPELVELFSLLRGAGAELHYIYIPCSPIHGNSVYWSPITKGLAAGNYLRAHLSDRVIPRICTATPIGKMDWHTSGWAVEPVEGNPISCGSAPPTPRIISSASRLWPTSLTTSGLMMRAPSMCSTWPNWGMKSSFWGPGRPGRPAEIRTVRFHQCHRCPWCRITPKNCPLHHPHRDPIPFRGFT
jgi:hypothetical protein